MLHCLTDAEAVIGTRTCRSMIAAGAEMKPMHRLANIAMAKYMELLYWNLGMRFTDVGCSYRALWKTTWDDIRDSCNGQGPEFAPEMTIEIARMRKKCIEIPIGYHPRYGGASKHGRNLAGLAKTAWRMGKLITGRKFPR